MSRSCRSLLVLVPLALSLVSCGRFAVPPVPGGEPVLLSPSRAATTWTDAEGGTLELKADGTTAAHHVCSDFDIVDGTAEPRSGPGTWESEDGEEGTRVHVSFGTDDESFAYEALRKGGTLKLWTYVGDPDEGRPLCILTAPAR
ncbi:hypothetical protein [Streptomyces sp. JH34]|uniref:hypothetical protein n=1 Tax=Streptomyces sp. JH34 TaxID=2793633 RepID=UPI0023F70FA7|nr:hypothetical protein [Streptomyces sp. JH34]MDF6019651.1 hypothetical protein [Streptomyces sp. JH34]